MNWILMRVKKVYGKKIHETTEILKQKIQIFNDSTEVLRKPDFCGISKFLWIWENVVEKKSCLMPEISGERK